MAHMVRHASEIPFSFLFVFNEHTVVAAKKKITTKITSMLCQGPYPQKKRNKKEGEERIKNLNEKKARAGKE